MSDTTAYIIVAIIGALAIGGPVLHWILSGKPVTDESKLLRRIYVLEQQVDELTKQLADMERLRAEVELLRDENRRLLLSLSQYMQTGVTLPEMVMPTNGDDIKLEIERISADLSNRRKWREKLNTRLVTTPSSVNSGFLLDAMRQEDKAIDELQDRLDMLRMARGED